MEEQHGSTNDEVLLNLRGRTNDELRELLDVLRKEEERISYRRRVLHGKIDILRAELVRRMKDQRAAGEDVISGHDIDQLITILASDLRGAPRTDVTADDADNEEDD